MTSASRDSLVFLITERLVVRQWFTGDADDYVRLLSAYDDAEPGDLTEEEQWAVDQTRDCLKGTAANPFPAPGFFHLPLALKDTRQLIGSVALNPYDAENNIPEIEWTIGPEFWNKGYATEIGKEMIRYGFNEAGFKKIVGFTRPDNAASSRVMEKLGMKFTGMKDYKNGTYRFYIIEKQDWK